ncbi:hypothetical protein BN12_3090005 [Nostocoides japonicum T1-X7]|uniref:Transposase n=1 Tax=Nostocoides japonicum T1-X7 TaxID=1194083 RepID=A0A077LXI3_9MICO|nr:hypothetical protein BN12_3090005 [Tetrasphaera japonica T1-X7]
MGIRRRPPSLPTVRRVLLGVDPDVLDAVLHAWLAATAPAPAAFRAVAVDGKTCRGARRPEGSRVHLFSIVDRATGIPLGQVNAGRRGLTRNARVRRGIGPARPDRPRGDRRRVMPMSA